MAEKSRWWNALFGRRQTTTTVEAPEDTPPPPPVPAAAASAGAPLAGGFSFLDPAAARAAAEAALPPDTQVNPALSTGRLRALGLAPVLIPSLAEQIVLHRLVAQEHAAAEPAVALGRWQAVLALCPDDLEARVGAARALSALDAAAEADAAWRQVLALSPDHPEAGAVVSPTEKRRALGAAEGE